MLRFFIYLVTPIVFVSCGHQSDVNEAQMHLKPRILISSNGVTSEPIKVDISVTSMTAQLLQGENTLLAEMDVSTGEIGHETPLGVFRVSEKMLLKRSNLYGQYVKRDTREVVVARHWEHVGPKPKGTVYQGIAMPCWMRLTDGGVGMHVGAFTRGVATSKGCIRCPEAGQTYFYQYCRVGTSVKIHKGSHPVPTRLLPQT